MKKLSILIVLAMTVPGMAAVYEVGPSRPYPDLQSVAGLLAPGDLVLVDGDHTYPGGVVFTMPGTGSQRITIRGIRINGNRPIVQGGVNTIHFATDWPYSGPGADHYTFEGFVITGGSFRGLYHQADDLIVRDVLVTGCAAHGILGADEGSGSMTLEYSEVSLCGSGTSQHQIYMATDEVHHPGSVFRMHFCFIHDGNGGNNVKSRAERNEIYYNWIEGALYHELELIGPEGADPSLFREDSDVVGNVLVKRNTFYLTRCGGDGTGETDGRYRFVNNTFICGTSAAFRLFEGIESIQMHNNVFYREGSPVTIVRSVEADWTTGSEIIAGSNNWVPSGAGSVPAQWTGTISGSSPGFADPGLDDYRPVNGSPLIDAGSASLSGPPGYPFPDPLPAAVMHPPVQAAALTASAVARPRDEVIDIGAFEQGSIWFVDDGNQTGILTGSRIHPFNSIQTAIMNASSGDAVFIAGGNYAGNLVVDDKRLVLMGGFAGADPLEYAAGNGGDFTNQDTAINVTNVQAGPSAAGLLLIHTGTSRTSIDGIDIRGGLHGIEIDDDFTSPLIRDVVISRNHLENNGQALPSHRGGGMLLTGNSHHIHDNVIMGNVSGRGAGVAMDCMDLTFSNNEVSSNIGYDDHGGGVYQSGTAAFFDNVIHGNRTGEGLGYGWGGGIVVLGTAVSSGDRFHHNHAPSIGGGIFVDEGGNLAIDHALIYANTTEAHDKGGAGVYVDGGEGPSFANLNHVTIADNSGAPGSNGNGIYVEAESGVLIENSILWGNGGDDFYHDGTSSILAGFCLSEETISGTGNINSDPLFADAFAGDYHLRSTGGRFHPDGGGGSGIWVIDSAHSPAIDAGNPSAAFDLEPSPNGERANIGAYGNTQEASKSGTGVPVPAESLPTIGFLLLLAPVLKHRKKPGLTKK